MAIAWLLSENRRAVPWRIVMAGALLQFVLAAALLKVPRLRSIVGGTLATLMAAVVIGTVVPG